MLAGMSQMEFDDMLQIVQRGAHDHARAMMV